MNFTQFQHSLAQSKISPLYVITGKEPFLKAETLRLIKSHLGEEQTFIKEYQSFSISNIEEVVADLYSKPLFEDWNLIVVRDAGPFLTGLYEPLSKYLAAPPPASVLVLEAETIDQRTRFAKLADKGVVVECKPLKEASASSAARPRSSENELTGWVVSRASHYEKEISREAVHLLQELVGNSLTELDLQLQKLSLFAEKRSTIEAADVAKLVAESKRVNIFEFLDAVFLKNVAAALPFSVALFARGNLGQDGQVIADPTHIALQCLRLIHYRLKQMWKLSVAHDTSGIPPFVVWKLKEQCHLFPPHKLKEIWRKLLETEFALKTSQAEPAFAVEQLVLFICT